VFTIFIRPRVPSVSEIKNELLQMLQKIPKEKLWVNPDCGLKTRGVDETIPSLQHLVSAAQRSQSVFAAMKISELFQTKRVLSLEIFPPKRTDSVDTIYHAIEELKNLNPDFISVTYGAGGKLHNAQTLQIASALKNRFGIESVAHLPCINLTREEALQMLRSLKRAELKIYSRCAGISTQIALAKQILNMPVI
jgi:hypothetical protein